MQYEEYKKLKDAIEMEYKRKLESLEMVWQMSRGDIDKQGVSDDKPTMSISKAMRKVISGLSGEFKADDVEQGMKDHGFGNIKRLQITNTLHRLMRRKELSVVDKGIGRKSSTYRKAVKTGEFV